MKVAQSIWNGKSWDEKNEKGSKPVSPQIALIFGERTLLSDKLYFEELKKQYPTADIIISSTSGEIIGNEVLDDSIVATIVEFEKTEVQVENFVNNEISQSYATGINIAKEFEGQSTKSLFVLSNGHLVNGTELLNGINSIVKGEIPVTGGLAGDKARFEKTLVGLNNLPEEGNVVVMALKGDHIEIGHGSKGGWDAFGTEREVTKSKDNVLYELDGKNALDLYKEYLGDRAKELPGSALLFPLLLKSDGQEGEGLVRTILGVNEEDKSMTFAGNLPEGSTVKLMKANFDKLIDGSSSAAKDASLNFNNPDLAILVSCVGRKLVLGQLTVEEVDEAISAIGDKTHYTGFYSYGEISPLAPAGSCELHNQTMTITTFKEV